MQRAARDTLASLKQCLTSAAHALKAFSDRGSLEPATAVEVHRLIALLADRLAQLPEALCHGEFRPKNIILQGTEPRLVYWEDAFGGVSGYDSLYWVTILENRPFLQTAAFGQTGLAPDVERAILALVVLLKSYLAVLSGAHLKLRCRLRSASPRFSSCRADHAACAAPAI